MFIKFCFRKSGFVCCSVLISLSKGCKFGVRVELFNNREEVDVVIRVFR